jgi:hypothetical protein
MKNAEKLPDSLLPPLGRIMMSSLQVGMNVRKKTVRRILGGIFFMLSVGAGILVGTQYGIAAGWLAFVLSTLASVMLHRLTVLFDENKIMDRPTKKWHKTIVAEAKRKLGRSLTDTETHFITSRGGGLALEMIHDNIRAGTKDEVISYLNSEARETSNQAL